MSPFRTFEVVRKDLRLGPRSPVFLWVLVLPLLITFVVQVAFGSLFDPELRLGIVDRSDSAVTSAMRQLEGIETTLLADSGRLQELVGASDLDAGLVLPEGFDDAVRNGERPILEFYVGGETHASDRIILAVTAVDLVRQIEGSPPPVEVDVVQMGAERLPLSVRLVPFVVMYTLLIAAVFLPSFSLADEREHGTLQALVVTPVRLTEVVVAKGIVGFVLALAMAVVTLWMNDALGAEPWPLIVVLLAAGLLLVEVGLIYATAAKDVTGVFTLIKGTGIILLGPTLFYMFPDWPQWIAKLFPTYWVIEPVYQVTVNGAGLGDVWGELAVALAVAVILGLAAVALTRRLGTQLGTT